MENNFLAVNKRYFGAGLKSLDILIVARIDEFQRNNCECHLTNQQFCEMFCEDINAVKRSIKKLGDMGIVIRHTEFIGSNGRSNRQRTLTVNKQWMAHNEPTIDEWKAHSEPSSADGRLKSGEWKAHSEPIKDKKKIIRDNVLKVHSEPTISPEEKESLASDGGLSGRRIRDLSEEEAKEIKAKLKQGIRYLDIESEYGMRRGTITSKFEEHWKQFLWLKVNGRI